MRAGEAADAELKTKTPHVNVGNNTFIVCGKLPRGVILKIYPPSNLQNHMVDSTYEES